MTHPKDPQAELHKLFRQICLRWGENQPHADPYHAYDEIYEEFAPKFNALFQAHQQELLSELLGELPEKYKHNHHHDIQTQDGKYKCLNCRKTPDEIAGNDNMGNCPHFRSYNKALSDVVSVIQSKIGELNG